MDTYLMYMVLSQVVLACDLGKPLFLHERDAHQQMVEILERFAERGASQNS